MLPKAPKEGELRLKTERLILQPVNARHIPELWDLYRDPRLHAYTPFKDLSVEEQKARLSRWSKRVSPDGNEMWLNWIGRGPAREAVGHFQTSINEDLSAIIGYIVARDHQRKGYAREALEKIYGFLDRRLKVRRIDACIDAENTPSIILARRLGMVKTKRVQDGASVFTKRFRA